MGRKKKPFIDKKNSVTFKLVQRSQNDPLFVDSSAPQYVLVEKKTKEEVLIDDEPRGVKKVKVKGTKKEEQSKYGIYFDDDYDYLQHLVGVEEIPSIALEINSKLQPAQSDGIVVKDEASTSKPKLMLPSSVFESTIKETVDLNKRAALPVGPQLDWDPDIVEAMDEDFDRDDPNNVLDDDFVVQAMQEGGQEEDDGEDQYNFDFSYKHKKMETLHEDYEDGEGDNLSLCGYDGSDGEDDDFDDFDAKVSSSKAGGRKRVDFDQITSKSAASHFTQYSITSSILPRTDNLQTLDQRFENFFIKEYADDTEVGALDSEEIAGKIDPNNSSVMQAIIDEFEEYKQVPRQYEPNEDAIEYVRKKFVNNLKIQSEERDEDEELSSSEDEFETIEIIDTGRKGDTERFDCESILSTMSNTLYQPTMLKETDRYGMPLLARRKLAGHIRIHMKTGMPVGVVGEEKQEDRHANLETKTMKTALSRMSELSYRPKGETPEERSLRKKELKEVRAARRAEKKANRLAFKDEKLRLDKQDVNTARQKKVAIC